MRGAHIGHHSPPSFDDSDLIILLEKVEIAEQGTHEEMMALGGRYAQMYRKQMELGG